MAKLEELRKDGSVKKSYGWLKGVIFLAVAAPVLLSSFTIVPAGHTGVILTLGKVSET